MTIDTVGSDNPFAIVTFIAAPAILTNAASILALSTSNRMLRVADRVQQLAEFLRTGSMTNDQRAALIRQAKRVHRQSRHFLKALRAIYLSLSAFALASFVALIGALATTYVEQDLAQPSAAISIVAGAIGVFSLVWAGYQLILASRLTMMNIEEDLEPLLRL